MIDFDGKCALITGAAQGIGAATALEFANHGADIVLADIDEAGAKRRATEINELTGRRAIGVFCDVASDDALKAVLSKTITEFGRIDILVNNAGIIRKGGILDLDTDDFDAVLNVNLRSYFALTQLAARKMVEAGEGGAVIMMSSLNAVLAIADQLAYVTSKGGLQQLTKACALGLAEHNIRVNAIGPGSIMTDILKVVMDDDVARKKILSRTPLGRVGDPDEIARVAVFLASHYASYITGQTIFPDGGRSALNYTVPVAE
ncbi:MAG: SDR family NAD(P)-dependent oxidoreductase [Pseudomonadota bacterium]